MIMKGNTEMFIVGIRNNLALLGILMLTINGIALNQFTNSIGIPNAQSQFMQATFDLVKYKKVSSTEKGHLKINLVSDDDEYNQLSLNIDVSNGKAQCHVKERKVLNGEEHLEVIAECELKGNTEIEEMNYGALLSSLSNQKGLCIAKFSENKLLTNFIYDDKYICNYDLVFAFFIEGSVTLPVNKESSDAMHATPYYKFQITPPHNSYSPKYPMLRHARLVGVNFDDQSVGSFYSINEDVNLFSSNKRFHELSLSMGIFCSDNSHTLDCYRKKLNQIVALYSSDKTKLFGFNLEFLNALAALILYVLIIRSFLVLKSLTSRALSNPHTGLVEHCLILDTEYNFVARMSLGVLRVGLLFSSISLILTFLKDEHLYIVFHLFSKLTYDFTSTEFMKVFFNSGLIIVIVIAFVRVFATPIVQSLEALREKRQELIH